MKLFNRALLASSIALVTAGVFASEPMKLQNDAKAMQVQQRLSAQTKLANMSTQERNAAHVIDVLVNVQPTYFHQFNEYDSYIRIQQQYDYANQIYANMGLNVTFNVVDINPTQSVENTLAFSEPDESAPELVASQYALGAHVRVAFNPGYPEYDLLEAWSPDMVGYFRENRRTDGTRLGIASFGFGLHNVLNSPLRNSDTDPILAHEISHNLEAQHELEDTVNQRHAHGHAYQCTEKTLMWSSDFSAEQSGLPVISSDDVVAQNGKAACGVAGEADNHAVIAEVGQEATLWREGIDTPSEISLSQTSYSVNENEDVTVTLTRTGDISQPASVKVFARNDTATWPEDFTTVFALAEFESGEASASVTIDVAEDVVDEGAETFNLVLLYPYKATVGTDTAVVTVSNVEQNQSAVGTFSIASQTAVGESEGVASVLITRSGGDTGDVTLTIAGTETGSGRYDIDYAGLNIFSDRRVHFKDGQTTATVEIDITPDNVVEPDEVFGLTLSGPDYVSISNADAVVTIEDDDSTTAGVLSLVAPGNSVSEGGSITLTVERKEGFAGAIDAELEVSYSNGSSTQTVAFNIADGEGDATLEITVPDNASDEPNYTLTANLTVIAGDATVETAQVSLSVIDNDTASSSGNANSNSDNGGGGSVGFISALLLSIVYLRRKLKLN